MSVAPMALPAISAAPRVKGPTAVVGDMAGLVRVDSVLSTTADGAGDGVTTYFATPTAHGRCRRPQASQVEQLGLGQWEPAAAMHPNGRGM
jgi:hypothetical protein